ncbi:WD40 repeat-like protein [Fomitiporia mediterranea MF3/22]|uniref:WD40 repeat-like protein n=1 Tax=Fomitiporia mediterranea (strain MF3/22) TaxID=694068 RepID=UPI0004408215|nr:WD40 repeat-like protein [Fomitiporia mediterranea MF3/22]EJD05239.1 WD40 repeat-like protein [Fomitiporia mediterranea MF3/22]
MASAPTRLDVTVIRASEVKWDSTLRSKLPNLYVQIELGNESRRTKTIKKNLSPEWNECLSFNRLSTDERTMIIIQIKHDSSRWMDKYLGKTEVELKDLLGMCSDAKEVTLLLETHRGSPSLKIAAVLHLQIEAIAIDSVTMVGNNVKATEQVVQQSGISSSAAATDSAPVASVHAAADHFSEHTDLYESAGALVSRLNVFVSSMDALSQIHPYANFAWQLASALYKVVRHQFEVDKKVVELVHAMRNAFDFVDEIDTLRNKAQKFEASIIQLLEQTDECCLFIQEYARHKFARRMLMLNVDETIDKFLDSLQSLKTSIDSEIVVHIAFVSSRMSSKVDVMFLKSQLNPDEMDAYHRPHCLPGTRANIQNEIVEWASACTDQNIFWLHGVAGSGKSTVSTTIAEHFRTISRLGAHLFFERGKSDPSSVIRTLAYRLSTYDSSVEKHVSKAIEQDNEIARATAVMQFKSLLHGPLSLAANSMQGPVVIVLDALDECGTEATRQSLLESFRTGLPLLPKQFRFLITSRKELDIDSVLSYLPDCIHVSELDHDSESCKGDVLRYVDYELRKVFTRKRLPITDDWQWKMERLTVAADGLFIWASTAVREISRSSPARKLRELVSQTEALAGLDLLYDSVLRGSGISFDDKASKEHFARVLGLLLLGKASFSDRTIDEILGFSDEEPSQLILSCLQSILEYTPDTPVRFCHTSFRDYLRAPERKGDPWFIDLESQKESIASRCLDVMRDGLRFNICDIESSYVPNSQITYLPDRIKAHIPPQLEYTCLFWAEHLHEAQFSGELLNGLSQFLSIRLLYWLEVMSLLGKVNAASPALLHIMNWVSSHNAEVLTVLRDARRIITRFAVPISQSTPHIYVSIFPFVPMVSPSMIHNVKHDLLVQVDQIGEKQQSPLLMELTGHKGWIRSVAFSPDSTRVASGSWDKTIRVWDAESGQLIAGPLEGHEDEVRSIAFSPDGARVVSGSDDTTIRIWNIESGQVSPGLLKGHTGPVRSVKVSTDGRRVVSGSEDKTIIVWDIACGQPVSDRFEGHTDIVNSVDFSPDGKRIASGSDDKTIRIWDTEKGRTICGPLEGHVDIVTSVAFSYDATRVVSGSADQTIQLWDTESGKCISGPFKGHTKRVNSVAFSPDGKRVVSGAEDRTVRIWDIESGQVISGPFEGHTNLVSSVAFSSDGTRVVSGSWDYMVRIWDTESEQTGSGEFKGHTGAVYSAAFSPEGKRIASGSLDETIRIWDVDTRSTVSGPFKGHSNMVWSIAFSPDGRHVVSGSADHTIRVWDAESGEVGPGPFNGHKEGVRSVAFSPDGRRVVSGSDDKTVRIWDVKSGQTISGPFEGHDDGVCSVTFSPEGRRVVSGSFDKTIILWDAESGTVISGPWRGHTHFVREVAFSPDGTRIVSGSNDKTILIWDVASGKVIVGPLKGHTDIVRSVAFSPDGARIVSGSEDRTIRFWDAESGQTVSEPLEGHTSAVFSVNFSPDGKRLVSGSWDRIIRMWNVEDPIFDWTMDKDGWIHGREGELLVWVPPDLRTTLWRPQNTAIINCAFLTKLDFSNATLGERWQECFVRPR